MKVTVSIALLVAFASASYVVEWSASANYSSCVAYTSNSHVSYDVDGDSIPEVMLMDSSALKVYSGVTHNLLWSMPSGGYAYLGYPTIANTDGDAAKEIVYQAQSYTPNYKAKFYVYDCASHSLEYSSPEKSGYAYTTVADIDGDNKSEIIITSGDAGSRKMEVYGSDDADVREMPGLTAGEASASALPNPAARSVLLSFPRPVMESGPILVMDASGRVTRHLELRARERTVTWDCTDDLSLPVPTGTYLYRCYGQSGKIEVVR